MTDTALSPEEQLIEDIAGFTHDPLGYALYAFPWGEEGSGPQTVMATVTDAAGNSDSETHTVTVNLTAPTIGINTIATDDIINATEKGADLQISGTSNQPAGTTITVTLNGQNYTATTDASGNWSTTVPASAVGALGSVFRHQQ